MTMWDGIVGNAAQALSHPDLTSAIRSMHPGLMPKAEGGITAYADGGAVAPPIMPGGTDPSLQGMPPGMVPGAPPSMPAGLDPNDPRLAAIGNAEDALHTVETGGTLQPHHAQALQTFTNTYGMHALRQLHANVKAGMRMNSVPRMVVGAQGNDKVPAVVDGKHKAKLTTGEFVMPVDAVAGAGQGDPVAGAQRLQHLSVMLAAMKPATATKQVTSTALTQQIAPVPPMAVPGALNVDNIG